MITAAAFTRDEVNLANFDHFRVVDRAARSGRYPATGETIAVPASKRLAFFPAKTGRDALNSRPGVKAAAD